MSIKSVKTEKKIFNPANNKLREFYSENAALLRIFYSDITGDTLSTGQQIENFIYLILRALTEHGSAIANYHN